MCPPFLRAHTRVPPAKNFYSYIWEATLKPSPAALRAGGAQFRKQNLLPRLLGPAASRRQPHRVHQFGQGGKAGRRRRPQRLRLRARVRKTCCFARVRPT
jgi:hypothetical protein